MAVSNLVIGSVMGLVLLVIAGSVNVVRRWRRESPEVEEPGSALLAAANSPAGWTVGFVVVSLLLGIGGVAFVGGIEIPAMGQGAIETIVLGALGALLAFFLLAGIYAVARDRGLGSAPAVGVISTLLGLLVIVAVVAQLLVG